MDAGRKVQNNLGDNHHDTDHRKTPLDPLISISSKITVKALEQQRNDNGQNDQDAADKSIDDQYLPVG